MPETFNYLTVRSLLLYHHLLTMIPFSPGLAVNAYYNMYSAHHEAAAGSRGGVLRVAPSLPVVAFTH
jgi:hypothetical protein